MIFLKLYISVGPGQIIIIYLEHQEDTMIVVVTPHVSGEAAGSSRSQEEVEEDEEVEEEKGEEEEGEEVESLFLGPPPLSSSVPLNPSVSQEKDQNLHKKHIF